MTISLKTRDFGLEVKAVEDDGTFSGYGSVFGVKDSYNEIVAPGAFAESLAEIKRKGRPLPVLWQHRADQPMGVYDVLKEDEKGLYVEGRLLKNDVAQAKEAYALMKAGAVSGLSIGYYVRDDSFDEKTRIRTLKRLDLVEVSLVTFPANPEARILRADDVRDERAFERLLREVGFPRAAAARLAKGGWPALKRQEPSQNPALVARVLAAAQSLKNAR